MLQNNDVFASLTFARAGGGEIHLPAIRPVGSV
jgi:hypothetical protein